MSVTGPAARTQAIGDLPLESGEVLRGVEIAYETFGALNADRSNAVLVQHALTADSHVATTDPEEPGWWGPVVGPGQALDTDSLFVVCANMIGGCGGSTGPSSRAPDGLPYGSRFPSITLRDAAHAEARLADALGIDTFRAVIGGSMGGARALEWAIEYPERVAHVVVLAAPAYSNADQLAWAHTQILAIEMDPDFCGGDYEALGRFPYQGLGLARRIAHLTYRDGEELGSRFGNKIQERRDPRYYMIDSYLDHQARKLVARFDANSYLVLTRALRDHDVRRGRGSLEEALSAITAKVTLIAISSDRLYPPHQVQEISAALAAPVPVHTIESVRGHDGFLLEYEALADILTSEGILPEA